MKKAVKRRSFWQYNKDNWPVFIPFTLGIGFGFFCLTDGAPKTGAFFFLVSAVCVVGSLIDWKRLG